MIEMTDEELYLTITNPYPIDRVQITPSRRERRKAERKHKRSAFKRKRNNQRN